MNKMTDAALLIARMELETATQAAHGARVLYADGSSQPGNVKTFCSEPDAVALVVDGHTRMVKGA